MTDTELKDGFYGFFTGIVSQVGFYKDGMYVRIEFTNTTSEGREYKTRATAWGIEGNIVSAGDHIKVGGWVTCKPDLYEKDGVTKASVDISLNKPKIVSQERLVAANAAPPVEEDAWATAAIPSAEDTPF
jgi:hypothetical protein